jgi:hypothetical protein
MYRSAAFVLLAAPWLTACWAEEKVDVKPGRVTTVVVRLLDRTTVHRATLPDHIEFVTRYGKLTIPTADIRRLEFGRHVSEATDAKIADLVKELGGADFKQREAAKTELIAIGAPAYPVLKAALHGADLDLTGRLRETIGVIEEQVPEELLNLPAFDRLVTADCVLAGRIVGTGLKIRASAFGEVTLKLSEVRSFHAIDEASLAAEAVKVAATDDQWLETDFTVDADAGLVFTASGKIDLDTTQAGVMIAGPDGNAAVGMGNGGPIGLLMGRIGLNGTPFPIGKRTAVRTGLRGGKLYLHVVPGAAGENVSGGYKVRVVTDPDVPEDKRLPDNPFSAAADPTPRLEQKLEKVVELKKE